MINSIILAIKGSTTSIIIKINVTWNDSYICYLISLNTIIITISSTSLRICTHHERYTNKKHNLEWCYWQTKTINIPRPASFRDPNFRVLKLLLPFLTWKCKIEPFFAKWEKQLNFFWSRITVKFVFMQHFWRLKEEPFLFCFVGVAKLNKFLFLYCFLRWNKCKNYVFCFSFSSREITHFSNNRIGMHSHSFQLMCILFRSRKWKKCLFSTS